MCAHITGKGPCFGHEQTTDQLHCTITTSVMNVYYYDRIVCCDNSSLERAICLIPVFVGKSCSQSNLLNDRRFTLISGSFNEILTVQPASPK